MYSKSQLLYGVLAGFFCGIAATILFTNSLHPSNGVVAVSLLCDALTIFFAVKAYPKD